MKKIVLGLGAVALLSTGGIALAQQAHDGKAGHARGHMAQIDADSDGRITRQESLAGVDAMFARMDANGDGRLDATDRAAMRTQMRAKMWDRLDGNDDASVSKAEWDAAQADRQAKRAERQAKRTERRAQRQAKRAAAGTEASSDAMRRGAHRAMMASHGGRGMAMLRRADTDNDRAVTLEEARAAAAQHFAMIDADGDGVASAAEMQAMRARHKAGTSGQKDD